MLVEAQIEAVFKEYLPDDVTIIFVDKGPYLLGAMLNPAVQHQVQAGVYTYASLSDDFLGWAMSLTEERLLHVCMPLLENLAVGLTTELVDVLVRHTAAHEAHHFDHHHGNAADDVLVQLHREQDCIDYIAQKYPDLDAKIQVVYAHGDVFRRVFNRLQVASF